MNGLAVQRFAVRNSGATVVVEGCGNHGCEYMTGGVALVLGEVGLNFAAGMSGGVAYVFDEFGTLAGRCNTELVDLERPSSDELELIRSLIEEHAKRTSSPRGIKMLYRFETCSKQFVKVIPRDYKRVLEYEAQAKAAGKNQAEAEQYAFDAMTEGK